LQLQLPLPLSAIIHYPLSIIDSDHTNTNTKRAHSGPAQQIQNEHGGSRYDLRNREPAAGREAHM
jgi:hypothetical protein